MQIAVVSIPGKEKAPSYLTGRHLAALLQGSQDQIHIFDCSAGGNPGLVGWALIDAGFTVDSFEPYQIEGAVSLNGVYGVIIAIEMLEHCHDLAARFRPVGIDIVQTAVGLCGLRSLPMFPNQIFTH